MPKLCEKCGEAGDKKCAICKKVYYCCKAHQVEEWGSHRERCHSDWTVVFKGKIDDYWGQSESFSFQEPMSRKDKKALLGKDNAAANEFVRRLQKSMYLSNSVNLNNLKPWRCTRVAPPSVPNKPKCKGAIASGCVMHSAEMHMWIDQPEKQLVIEVSDNEIFPLCTDCVKIIFDNETLREVDRDGCAITV